MSAITPAPSPRSNVNPLSAPQKALRKLGLVRDIVHNLGCPIQGDRVHGGSPAPRLLLHARSLRLPHPRTGQTLVLRAPLPGDFGRAELVTPPGGCEVRPAFGDSSVPPGSNQPDERSTPP